MNDEPAAVLIVDDEAEMARAISDLLQGAGYHALTANSGPEALDIVKRESIDLVISDLRMAEMSGHQLQGELHRVAADLPVIIITAFGSIESAVESMKLGARDFITKPFGNEELLRVVSHALENRKLRQEVRQLRGELARSYGVTNIIASDSKMAGVLEMIEQVADSQVSVLLTGESGTGKDLLARAIHFSSPRREGPFVPINCGAIPDNLIESELFGYIRGAFTDARQPKIGLVVAARGGTLFLDEIGEMPLPLQTRLLRVLEDKKVRPLGATEEISVDVRVVAATNADLDKAIEEGRFRSDLYYRLATVTVAIPPLRERPADLPLLIKYFLSRASAEAGRSSPRIEPDATERLLRYSWPGNVRELQNAIQRGVILSRNNVITVKDLPPKIAGLEFSSSRMLTEALDKRMRLDELERDYIHAVLNSVNGNKTEAAGILGIDRKTLYRKLEEPTDAEAQ
ncbi:MAG TPA: sigma-54 dependent transcriptional regulator [Candidatus Binataceae bacterium]|nr:sigma-54 dependent transcriptional regulator [Candidatus Binataceae bacterium]